MVTCRQLSESGISSYDWDNYVDSANNGTIFHTRKFLGYHRADKFVDTSLVFNKRDRIIALLPAARISNAPKNIYISHPGASWGGFVYRERLKYSEAEELVSKLVEYCRAESYDRIELTLPPQIYYEVFQDDISFALLKHDFIYKKRELSSVVNVSSFSKEGVDRSVRKGVNKAERLNIEIKESINDWDDFYQLLTAGLADKGASPTHALSELLRLKELFPDRIILWGVYSDGRLVGGMCNWRVSRDTWLVFYSTYDLSMSDSRILDFLFFSCLERYSLQGVKYLDFGTSSLNMQVNPGLINFKENFGAYSLFRDTYSLDLC